MGLPVLSMIMVIAITASDAAPWRNYEVQQSQVCGDKLADMLSLVCSGRGYNVAFMPEDGRARRVRRGIVEECCHRSCTPALLELYCRADTTEPPSNVQIRKRSDSGVESTEHQPSAATNKQTTVEAEVTNKINQRDSTSNPSAKEAVTHHQFINLLASELSPQMKNSKTSVNKSTPNDTTEEEFFQKSDIPPLRHHKSHQHHNRRKMHSRKATTKTKRDKNFHGGNTRTFEIGTVKPYFLGRAFASYRNSYAHPASLS